MMAKTRHRVLKWALWAIASLAAILAAALLGAAFLLLHRPQAVKPWVEKALGHLTGSVCTIEEWDFSLRPLRLEMAGIRLLDPKSGNAPLLRIARLEAQGDLQGPLGRRTLRLNQVQLQRPVLSLSQARTLPPLLSITAKRPGFAARIGTSVLQALLFRKARVETLVLSGGTVTWERPDTRVRITEIEGSLDLTGDLRLDGKARLWLRSGQITLAAAHWQLTAARPPPLGRGVIEGVLRSTGCSVAGTPVQTRTLTLEAAFRYEPAENLLILPRVQLRTDETDWFQGTLSLPAVAEAEARVHVRQKKMRLSRFHLRLGKLAAIGGDAELEMEPVPKLKVHLDQGTLAPAEVPPSLVPRPWRERLQLDGPLLIGGTLEGRRNAGAWQWRIKASGRLNGNALAFQQGPMKVTGTAEGEIHARGTYPSLELNARFKLHAMDLDSPGFRLHAVEATARLGGTHPVYDLRHLGLRIARAQIRTKARWLEWKDIRLSAQGGRLDATRWAVSLPHTVLQGAALTTLSMAIEADRNGLRADFRIAGLDVAAASRFSSLAGWQFAGQASLKGSVTLTASGTGTFSVQATAGRVAFENPSGDWIGEGLGLELQAAGRLSLPGPSVEGRTQIALRQGEILVGTFYAALSQTPLLVSVNGAVDARTATVDLIDGRLELQDVLKATLHGTARWRSPDSRLQAYLAVPDTPIGPLFDHLIREPLQAAHPVLAQLRVEGTLGADLSIRGSPDGRELRGRLRWLNGALAHPKPAIRAEGIQMVLPLWHVSSGSPSGSDAPVKGSVHIQNLHIPGLPEQGLSFDLRALPERLTAVPSGPLQVPGGRIELSPCRLSGLFTGRPLVETSLRIDDLSLDPWLSPVWPSPVRGTLSGELKPIRLQEGRLTTAGGLHGRVFGGQIHVTSISASGLFGPAPSVTLDARWEDIDLGRLTGGTPFGIIEGRLKGQVKGLEIAFGQPQRFKLLVETVKRPGVPQRISVKAVDNIALIGGGQSPFMGLAGRLAALFKTFPYERIGLRASLANDVFTIRGTIHEKGKEYLVKRSGFSGVDVVNQNPDNRISFRDMIKRIKRVRAKGGGPIIR